MTEDRSVTIVITTYNHAHYLAAALDSVFAQTVPATEVIVVDDGSRDDPAAVVARYPGVRLIRQQNQGLSGARNTGIAAATSRYIGFLDADDKLRPRMIELNLAQFAEKPDCAFVYGAYDLVDDDFNLIRAVQVRYPGRDAFSRFLSTNLVGMHGTVLFRRDLLQAAGGYDTSLTGSEDYDIYLRLTRDHPSSAVAEALADYRRHGGNMSGDYPFMLRNSLKVLSRQKDLAMTRPEWAAAFDKGVRYWQRHYIGHQLGQLRQAFGTRTGLGRAVSKTVEIARLAPGAAARMIGGQVFRRGRRYNPFVRRPVFFGSLRRVTPINRDFGHGRGKPVDRYYVERFLDANRDAIAGRVLEIGDNSYTMRFGGAAVTQSDVLNRYAGNPGTTFVGDLADGSNLPDDTFDCIVLTQTLHLLFDMPKAVATLHRILKPGGILLVTVPWASPIDAGEWGEDWCWSITPNALRRLLAGPFPTTGVTVDHYGNVLSATAFLYGLAEDELKRRELDVHDPYCPVLVTGRAVKAATGATP